MVKQKEVENKNKENYSTQLFCDYCGDAYLCEITFIGTVKALCPKHMCVKRNTVNGLPNIYMFCQWRCKKKFLGC